MKKFRFRLQKVMEIKEEVEKQRMIDLSEAKQAVDQETTRLNHLNEEQIDCQHRIDEKSSTEKINPG
jgi:flagellar biosynthesis chaperone FliJ